MDPQTQAKLAEALDLIVSRLDDLEDQFVGLCRALRDAYGIKPRRKRKRKKSG
jgi:hypothetical protein